MYWADKVAKQILDSGKFKPFWVDDMKTLSGFPTIGSLRGPFVHDFIYKALLKLGVEAKSTYIFNDFDPMDDVPPDLAEKFSKYLGLPLKNVPSPEEGFPNYADYFAADFGSVLRELGVDATFLSSWDMYHEGKFDEVIKEALDAAEKIQDIYQKISGSKKRQMGWLPFQAICEKCGKLGTTRVHAWDGSVVEYTCEENMVKWAKGCGYTGKVSPFGGSGKLPWKVDWPAHWKVLGITIEGAGKDHSSAGGSRDIAAALCKEVFHIENPYNLPYEFFLIGGRKMSTSKGIGFRARDVKEILPPTVIRFLFCRSDHRQTVEFDPIGTMAIPDLFDEYDRCFKAYIDGSDEMLARTFEMAQIGDVPHKKEILLPRFRDIVNYVQMPNVDILQKYEEIKGENLSQQEIDLINERIKYAKIWIKDYAPDSFRIQLSETLPDIAKALSDDQKKFLKEAIKLIQKEKDPESLQLALYNLTKELGVDAKKSFSAIYICLIGKEFGPKAAWFLLSLPKDKVIERFMEVLK